MSKQSAAVISWRARTKERIVQAMGGKCVVCGYSKHPAVFDLHHLDRSTKSFSFGGLRANPVAWKKICEELKKCILVCANCHREIEAGIVDDSVFVSTFDVAYEDYTIGVLPKSTSSVNKNCIVCNIEMQVVSKRHKFCSDVCRKLHVETSSNKQRPRKTVWPEKEVLKELLKTMTYVAIGKTYGVSDNSVRYWAKQYKIII